MEESSYKALFGCEVKVGIISSIVPKELLNSLKSEKDLEKVYDQFKLANDFEKTVDEASILELGLTETTKPAETTKPTETKNFIRRACKKAL